MTSSVVVPAAAATSTTRIAAVVSVPVLSSTTVSAAWIASSARNPVTKIPSSAPRPVATMIAVGVARPSAQGQAMTSTATARATASPASAPPSSQPVSVSSASPSTAGTKTAETRSTRRWAADLPACASSTARSMWDSRVDSPTRSARTVSTPPTAIVPPTTASPSATSTGAGSPVIALVSTAAAPATTVPSAAMRSPGRTTNRSPTRRCATGTRCSAPRLPRRTVTSSGRSLPSARTAPPAARRARVSKYRPASWNVVMPAATSR